MRRLAFSDRVVQQGCPTGLSNRVVQQGRLNGQAGFVTSPFSPWPMIGVCRERNVSVYFIIHEFAWTKIHRHPAGGGDDFFGRQSRLLFRARFQPQSGRPGRGVLRCATLGWFWSGHVFPFFPAHFRRIPLFHHAKMGSSLSADCRFVFYAFRIGRTVRTGGAAA